MISVVQHKIRNFIPSIFEDIFIEFSCTMLKHKLLAYTPKPYRNFKADAIQAECLPAGVTHGNVVRKAEDRQENSRKLEKV